MEIKTSEEQQLILISFNEGNNIAIEACAGSGKTTAIILLALANPNKQFIVFTYNRRLSDETKERLNKFGITNVEIQTYHGFCTKYFSPSHNDTMLARSLYASPHEGSMARLKMFDVFIIDEMQDMNELYYTFVHNKVQYFKENIQRVLLGDPRQTIYQFNGGNGKYLSDPETYWGVPFTRCFLNTTYRLTHKVVDVVNTLIGSKYSEPFAMKSIDKPTNNPVEYHFVNLFGGGKSIIMKAIRDYGLNNVLLIGVSVKEKTPMNRVLNDLSAAGVNMCVLKDDDGPIEREVLRNKLLASSIHKQKGCERECVILYGLDCSYHKYYGKDKHIDEYLNLIYVAFTRSLKKLIIIGDKGHSYLKNWHQWEINNLIKRGSLVVYNSSGGKCDCSLESKCLCNDKPYKMVYVTDLTKYRSFTWLDQLANHNTVKRTEIDGIEVELISDKTAEMNNGLVEHVSTIYGVLIPIIVEFFFHKKIKTVDFILSEEFILYFKEMQPQLLKHLDKGKRYEMFNIYDKIKKADITDLSELISKFYEEFAQLSLCVLCYDNYVYPLHQIDNFNWIDIAYVNECCYRLVKFKEDLLVTQSDSKVMSHNDETRVDYKTDMVCTHPQQVSVKFSIYGRIDDMIGNILIEYKISKNFGDNSHFTQLLNYMWMMKKSIGYLYYPNLDRAIKIEINDFLAFDKFSLDWLNRLCIEYYHLTLKKNPLSKVQLPKKAITMSHYIIKKPTTTENNDIDENEEDVAPLPKRMCQL